METARVYALHDIDSRAAFPTIRQGLWERPAAKEIQLEKMFYLNPDEYLRSK